MEDGKVLIWVAALVAGAYLLLLKWVHGKAHNISTELKEEKKQTVWRVDEIYKRIDLHKTHAHENRKEVDAKMERLMTETQVKDFVDRSLKPIYKSLDSLNANVEKVSDSTGTILSSVKTLIERDSRSRKDD